MWNDCDDNDIKNFSRERDISEIVAYQKKDISEIVIVMKWRWWWGGKGEVTVVIIIKKDNIIWWNYNWVII